MSPSDSAGPPKRSNRVSGTLTVVAGALLCVGVLVYLLGRQDAVPYFLHLAPEVHGARLPFLQGLAGQLPSFVHVYAFILLSVAVAPKALSAMSATAFWCSTDALFEIAQHPAIAERITAASPPWLQRLPGLDVAANYFLRGTFDAYDLLAIGLGSLLGFLTCRVLGVERT